MEHLYLCISLRRAEQELQCKRTTQLFRVALLSSGHKGREATASHCYFLPFSCEFVVDIHIDVAISYPSITISSSPVLFLIILTEEVRFSKEWPLNLQNFACAISNTSTHYTCRLSWLPEFTLHLSMCRGPEQPTELALHLSHIFPKILLGAVSGILPSRNLESDD